MKEDRPAEGSARDAIHTGAADNNLPPLADTFGRQHTYLRISLTDRCNFRCHYCMPDTLQTFLPAARLMQAGEIAALAGRFTELGVNRIRLTGGEPLLRRDFADIALRLAELPAELLLTTNGEYIDRFLPALRAARISKINISLDSLRPDVFYRITRRNTFHRVWKNVLLLIDEGFRVKLNVVAVRGDIEEELAGFIGLTRHLPLHVRFIEFMPFSGNHWNREKVITAGEMLETIRPLFSIEKLTDAPHATARKFRVHGHAGTFAFITTMSHLFCGDCNRLRLTADGRLKNCLFGKEEPDLLGPWRRGEDIVPLIRQAVSRKHAEMGGQFPQGYRNTAPGDVKNRSMVSIGG
jgi:cyclic pyranopterin phosphate synthase